MPDQPSLRRNSRANFERILDEMLVRPDGHDALAAEMDRRQASNAVHRAKYPFAPPGWHHNGLVPSGFGPYAAARQIIARMDEANPHFPEDRRLYASIGIGHGPILNLDEDDIFGDEVNLASKLGEDVAESGTVLLTDAAKAEAAEAGIETRPEAIHISGISLAYHVLVRSENEG